MKFEVFISREISPDFVSKCIMKFTNAEFSHIGILIDNKRIIHATGEGVNEKSLDEFLKKKLIVGKKELVVKNEQHALGWLEGNLGKDYSETQYIGFLMPLLKGLFKDGDREMICSEFVYKFAKIHAIYNLLDKDQDYQSPKDVWNMIL